MGELELKPCPFCGAAPKAEWDHWAGRAKRFTVSCDHGKSLAMAKGSTKVAAITRWNTRKEPSNA